MNPQKQFLKRTINANPKIKIVLQCFLKLNIDMHSKTTEQLLQLIDFILILLKKNNFQFKMEILSSWKHIKFNITLLHLCQYNQNDIIEEFIDDFIEFI